MVHRGHSNWKVQKTVNKRRHFVWSARGASGGRVELLEQSAEVPQPLRPGRMLERLVLRQHIHEPLAEVVAVPAQSLTSAVAEPVDDLPDLAFGAELVRYPAQAARPS